jgi:membrane-bound serine protease (ClpP class)
MSRTRRRIGTDNAPHRRRSHHRATHWRRRLVYSLVLVTLIVTLMLVAAMGGQSGHAQGEGKDVRLIEIDGIIDPQVSGYVVRNIELAEDEGADAVLITIDTPGGLDEPMRDIIRSIINSPLPVITYVHPSGGRAASAGTFIAMASDVVDMAPIR